MEHRLRTALLDWLRADPTLAYELNAIEEESPVSASPPWLGIAASAGTDWSVKGRRGREIRLGLELFDRTDDAARIAATAERVEQRIATFMPDEPDFALASIHFLRSRAERRKNNARAMLLEYRFRVLAPA